MGRQVPNRKYAQEIGTVLPDGYTVERVGSRHPRILKPNGEPLRDAQGRPVTIAGSPSSGGSARNDIAKIRRALRGDDG